MLYLYRTFDSDDDGDSLDHGVLRANDRADIAEILRSRLIDELGNTDRLEVMLYPLADDGEPGVLKDGGEFFRVLVGPS